MNLTKTGTEPSLIDVLDRILNKGVVVESWERSALFGIDLITVKLQVIIVGIDIINDSSALTPEWVERLEQRVGRRQRKRKKYDIN